MTPSVSRLPRPLIDMDASSIMCPGHILGILDMIVVAAFCTVLLAAWTNLVHDDDLVLEVGVGS